MSKRKLNTQCSTDLLPYSCSWIIVIAVFYLKPIAFEWILSAVYWWHCGKDWSPSKTLTKMLVQKFRSMSETLKNYFGPRHWKTILAIAKTLNNYFSPRHWQTILDWCWCWLLDWAKTLFNLHKVSSNYYTNTHQLAPPMIILSVNSNFLCLSNWK